MGVSSDPATKEKTPRVVELVGPAGGGKTTLSKVLRQKNENFLVADDLVLRNPEHLIIFVKYIPSLLPILYQQYRTSHLYSWDEIKSAVYLLSWTDVLTEQLEKKSTIILLDHGPVFKLAKLDTFGPEKPRSEKFETWWQNIIQQWANLLDLVVWLDAPDTILMDRINNRNQKHAVKGRSKQEAKMFLERYRNSYEKVFSQLNNYGETALIRFDSSQTTIELIADEILTEYNLNTQY
jgi:deoxyadenosine/deoxycytidine kinase